MRTWSRHSRRTLPRNRSLHVALGDADAELQELAADASRPDGSPFFRLPALRRAAGELDAAMSGQMEMFGA